MKTYEKIIFTPGQLLKAAHLNHMEEGISEIEALAIVNEKKDDPVVITDNLGENFKSIISHIEPLQSGSGEPSPENIRPISGWDGVRLTQCGRNLFDNDASKIEKQKYIVSSGTESERYGYKIPLPVGSYRIKANTSQGSAGHYIYAYVIDADMHRLDGATDTTYIVTGTQLYSPRINIDRVGCSLLIINASSPVGTDVETTASMFRQYDIMLAAGEEALDFEPYNGTTRIADFPETVYGGVFDWETGILTVTHKIIQLTGGELWNAYGDNGGYRMGLESALNKEGQMCWCSHLPSHTDRTPIYRGETGCYVGYANTDPALLLLSATKAGISDVPKWLAEQYSAGTPVTIVYELAEPIIIQLTRREIKTLKGTNILYSDCGKTAVIYTADTKIYIDNKFTELQNAIVSLGGNV